MTLKKKEMILISFMLFSLFFGAGNLIFPPFLGQNAGIQTIPALIGFLITAVLLPVLGVIVVAKFDGLDLLASKVGKKFSLIFTILIYVSIGPGLGIPRAASVPFEMAVAPHLPEGSNLSIFMILYSLVFFALAAWLALNPGKLVDRIGKVLTPALLILISFLFISFMISGEKNIVDAQPVYQNIAFLQGFSDGYQTMDTIAALNFGLVIATTLETFGLKEKKSVIRHTVTAGTAAGIILALVYVMLSLMGMYSSGVYPVQDNGAWTLRCIVYQLYGDFGAVLLAAIFTLACLTTCVGLINSISQFFSTLWKKYSYKQYVLGISIFSFFICNLGLNVILSISIPILNAIYPVSIMLILLGLSDDLWKGNRFIYPVVIESTAVISVISALETAGISLGIITNLCHLLPLYSEGFGWVSAAGCAVILSVFLHFMMKEKK